MNLRRMRHRLRKSLALHGWIATASKLAKKAVRKPPVSPPVSSDRPKEYLAVHPFDQQHSVDTSGLIFPENLPTGRKEDLHNTGYFGVAPSVFRQVMDRLQLEYEKYTFLDLGSGKGRALLLASEYPFRAIVGVELSPRLHAIADANIQNYRGSQQRCRHVRSIQGDATRFEFPAGPLLVYLWNPFEGPVFARVLANLESALAREPQEVYIVYIQPDLDGLLEASSAWRKLWRDEFPLSENDYAAHAFPTQAEACSVYHGVSTGSPAN